MKTYPCPKSCTEKAPHTHVVGLREAFLPLKETKMIKRIPTYGTFPQEIVEKINEIVDHLNGDKVDDSGNYRVVSFNNAEAYNRGIISQKELFERSFYVTATTPAPPAASPPTATDTAP